MGSLDAGFVILRLGRSVWCGSMNGKTGNLPLESSPCGGDGAASNRLSLDELEAQDRLRKVLALLLEADLERMGALLEGRKSKDKGLYNGV